MLLNEKKNVASEKKYAWNLSFGGNQSVDQFVGFPSQAIHTGPMFSHISDSHQKYVGLCLNLSRTQKLTGIIFER